MPYLHVTTRLEDEPDKGMPQKFGAKYFPFLIFIDTEGEMLFELHPFDGGLEALPEKFKLAARDAEGLAQARLTLSKREGDKVALARISMIEALRGIRNADMKALEDAAALLNEEEELIARYQRYRAFRPFEAVKEQYEKQIADAQKESGSDYKAMVAATMKADQEAQSAMYELFKSGKTVADSQQEVYLFFWKYTIKAALAARDKEAAQAAYQALAKIEDNNPLLKLSLTNWKMQLDSF